MAQRSTRNKIKYNVNECINKLESCQKNMMIIDDLAGGQSDYLEKYIAQIVMLFDGLYNLLVNFRKGV